eukprot:gene25574-30879_t
MSENNENSTEEVEASRPGHEEEQDEQNEHSGLDYKDWNGVDIMKSLCMRCGGEGETRLMLHKIPHFRELVIASFYCEECGERNNEVTFGGEIQLEGCIYVLKVTNPKDLNRQIIKSDSASIRIREIDFEIPPHTQKGEINTLEGVLKTAAKNLALYQHERLLENPEVGLKVAQIIAILNQMSEGEYLPFHIEVDDCAGNSYVENPYVPRKDNNLSVHHYHRTREQDESLGLDASSAVYKDDVEENYKGLLHRVRAATPTEEGEGGQGISQTEVSSAAEIFTATESNFHLGRSEALSLPSPCPHCLVMGESLTAITAIPHFKEIIIMSFTCQVCGFKTNEVKAGGAVPLRGTEVRLRVTREEDLKRDVLKSDSAMVCIPELDLELGHGSLGGLFTTVEGLLTKIYKQLHEQNPFAFGDSIVLHHSAEKDLDETRDRLSVFMSKLHAFAQGQDLPFTLVIRDPLGNSFVSAPLGTSLPPELDTNLTLEDYDRSFEENEEFGLNDMNTKDFEVIENGQDEGMVALPDRLTQVYVKQADHPSVFAKGTQDDSTPNSVFYSPTAVSAPSTSNPDDGQEYCSPPAGWSVERVHTTLPHPQTLLPTASVPAPFPEDLNKRVFNDDSDLAFIPRESFYGRREGYVFRLGSQGLGYYQDRGAGVLPKLLGSQEDKAI